MSLITRRGFLGTIPAAALFPFHTLGQQLVWPEPDWLVLEPAVAGLDAILLEAGHQAILSSYPDITGVAVVRYGAIGFERYYGNDYGQNEPVDVRSITKCVTGTLIGMLI
ncbi:MAG TPA: hypothetical protein VIY86_01410, partial [Pirellulaceae bacterium]